MSGRRNRHQEEDDRDSAEEEQDFDEEDDLDEENEDDLDEEEEDEEDDDDQEEERTRRRKEKRKKSQHSFLDTAEEDSEEEEEEEEDEDEEEDRHKRRQKKKKKRRRGGLFEDAGAEEDNDEIEEDEHEEVDRRSKRPEYVLPPRRESRVINDPAEEVKILKERVKNRYRDSYAIPASDIKTSRIHQSINFPTPRDKKLFMIKIRATGRDEIKLMTHLMYLATTDARNDSGITSIISNRTDSGFIYIEADRLDQVQQLLRSVEDVNLSSKPEALTLEEMPSIFKVVEKKPIDLSYGSFVRIRKPKLYEKDIAQVIEVNAITRKVRLRLVPRITIADRRTNKEPKQNPFKANLVRPAAKLLSDDDLRTIFGDHLEEPAPGSITFKYRQNLFENGFLIKDFPVRDLTTTNVMPTQDEFHVFNSIPMDSAEDMVEGIKLNQIAVSFKIGDEAEVVSGELKGLYGEIRRINASEILLLLQISPGNSQEVSFQPSELRKKFNINDHVMILAGQYINSTGHIIELKGDMSTILLDHGFSEVKVFTRDLTMTKEISAGESKLGDFTIFDCVQLSSKDVGVIVGVEHNKARVLIISGVVRDVTADQIQTKKNTQKTKTADIRGNTISVGDIVIVREGPYRGKKGVVKHIFNSTVFLHQKGLQENNGIIVVRNINCASQADGMRPGLSMVPSSPRSQGKMNNHFFPSNRNTGTSSSRQDLENGCLQNGKHKLLGELVTIKSGPWKGYKGLLKDNTLTHCRIELQSGSRSVTVPNDLVRSDKAPSHGSSMYSSSARYPSTPTHHGGITPSHAPDSAWIPNSARPNYSSQADYLDDTDPRIGSSFDNSQTAETNPYPSTPSDILRNVYTPTNIFSSGVPQTNIAVSTPMTLLHTPNTPATSQLPRTPASFTPSVDGTSETSQLSVHSFKRGMHVRIKDQNLLYIIQRIHENGICDLVHTSDYSDKVECRWTELEHVPPQETTGMVYVFAGEYEGLQTTTLSIQPPMVIIKTREDFHPIPLSFVCVIDPDFAADD